MKDEGRCVIRLTQSSNQRGITLYHFQIQQCFKLYSFSARYSNLRTIAEQLPRTQIKFPEPHHVGMAFTLFLGRKSLLESRYSQMTKYFQQLSKLPQLCKSEGIKRILKESVLIKCLPDQEQEVVPAAPLLRGRALTGKKISDQLLIVIK